MPPDDVDCGSDSDRLHDDNLDQMLRDAEGNCDERDYVKFQGLMGDSEKPLLAFNFSSSSTDDNLVYSGLQPGNKGFSESSITPRNLTYSLSSQFPSASRRI